jgi:hypothetical protein
MGELQGEIVDLGAFFAAPPQKTGLSAPIFVAVKRQQSISASIPCAAPIANYARKGGGKHGAIQGEGTFRALFIVFHSHNFTKKIEKSIDK